MKIKTYVINLKESVDRKERVLAETKIYSCMNLEFVNAINGRNLQEEEIGRRFDCRRFVHRMAREALKGEIGCTLSHRECYRRIMDAKEEVALILEDDVCFLDPEAVDSLLKEIGEKMSRETPCIISLAKHLFYYKNREDRIGQYSLLKMREGWGAYAYLINNKAAEKMLAVSKPYFVADDYLLMNRMGVDVKVVYPVFAIDASEMSQMESKIGNRSHDLAKRTCRYFLLEAWKRICRQFLLRLHILEIRHHRADRFDRKLM